MRTKNKGDRLEEKSCRETTDPLWKIYESDPECTTREEEYGKEKIRLLREIYGDEEMDRMQMQVHSPMVLSKEILQAILSFQRSMPKNLDGKKLILGLIDLILDLRKEAENTVPEGENLQPSQSSRSNRSLRRWLPMRLWPAVRVRHAG
jgi:hypothetical protein